MMTIMILSQFSSDEDDDDTITQREELKTDRTLALALEKPVTGRHIHNRCLVS